MSKEHIRGADFVRLLTANQNRIFAYILNLVPNTNEADDIFQETTALMWEKYDEFQPGTDFAAWGVRIAYYKVLDYRKKKFREGKLLFSDEMFRRLAEKAPEQIEKNKLSYIDKLQGCISKLPSQDRELVNLRYSEGLSVRKIALRIHNSIRTIYYNLSRIHGQLLDCIESPNT